MMTTNLRTSFRRGLVEFIAIFLGVTLSFLADDWRDRADEREKAVGVLQGVSADLSQDFDRIREGLRYDSVAITGGVWMANRWGESGLPVDSVDLAARSLLNWLPYLPVRAEYESAKGAGRIQLIEDDALRSDLVAYYEEGQARLLNLNALALEMNAELGRLLRPYWRTRFSVSDAPVRSLAADWNEVTRIREIGTAIGEVANIRRIRAFTSREYLIANRELQASIERAVRGR